MGWATAPIAKETPKPHTTYHRYFKQVWMEAQEIGILKVKKAHELFSPWNYMSHCQGRILACGFSASREICWPLSGGEGG